MARRRTAIPGPGQGTLALEDGAPIPTPAVPAQAPTRTHRGPGPAISGEGISDGRGSVTRPAQPLPAPPHDGHDPFLDQITPDEALPGSSPSESEPESKGPTGSEAVRRGFRQELTEILDPLQWQQGFDPEAFFRTTTERAQRAAEQGRALRAPFRRILRERLAEMHDPPPYVGLHRLTEPELLRIARGYLYNGQTHAVCGDFLVHETLPLAIAHAGVSIVGYDGRQDQWSQRLYRTELEISLDDPVGAAEAVLSHHDRRRGERPGERLDDLTELARRGFVSYMERRLMRDACTGKWRLGYGLPVPLDLLTGMGNMELVEMSLELLRGLLLADSKWVWVTSTSEEPGFEMLAQALEPLEFAILTRLYPRLRDQVEIGRYPRRLQGKVLQFVEEVGRDLVLGAYRPGHLSPPRFFVGHPDRIITAAAIAMADSLSTQPQGYPALVQLARSGCRAALGGEGFHRAVEQAYRAAGVPDWQHRQDLR